MSADRLDFRTVAGRDLVAVRGVGVVTFYDASPDAVHMARGEQPGQYIASYYLIAFLLGHPGKTFILHGGVPAWNIDAHNYDRVLRWLS